MLHIPRGALLGALLGSTTARHRLPRDTRISSGFTAAGRAEGEMVSTTLDRYF